MEICASAFSGRPLGLQSGRFPFVRLHVGMDLLSRVIRLINSDGLDRIVLSHGAIVALAVTPAMGWQDLLDGEYSSILVVRL